MDNIIFKPYLKQHKAPLGALYCFEEVNLNILINASFNIYDLRIVVFDDFNHIFTKNLDFDKNEGNYNTFKVNFSLDAASLYWYHFEFNDCYGKHYICCNDEVNGFLTDKLTNKFQLTIKKNRKTKLGWYQGKVMYQIFPDRFFKGGNNEKKENCYLHNWNEPILITPHNNLHNNNYYGGDLKGVIKKLEYLKTLNVSVIYFNPIFEASSSHRYNTGNYLKIDSMLGSLDDFILLVKEAKKHDIEIILDGVFNHTGDDSIYFNKYNHYNEIGAYQDKNSIYYNWYRFINHPNEYHSWWGINSLPSVNQDSGFTDFICLEVIPYWMQFEIKGFRLDVVDEIKPEFVRKINKAIGGSDNIVIGEVWEDATNKISYSKRRTYFVEDELDSIMNYVIKDAIIDYLRNNNLNNLVFKLREMINNYPKENLDLLMNILSTHDTKRIMTSFSKINEHALSKTEKISYCMDQNDYIQARSKLKMAFVILYTIPGIPCIYYGDEVGMEGYRDPYCRRSMEWNNVDCELLNFFKTLGNIRNDSIFIDGVYEEEYYDNNIFVYKRIKEETIIVIINNSYYDFNYNVSGYDLIENEYIENKITVYEQTAKIIKLRG